MPGRASRARSLSRRCPAAVAVPSVRRAAPSAPPIAGEQQAFRQQLPHQPRARGAERQPDRQLFLVVPSRATAADSRRWRTRSSSTSATTAVRTVTARSPSWSRRRSPRLPESASSSEPASVLSQVRVRSSGVNEARYDSNPRTRGRLKHAREIALHLRRGDAWLEPAHHLEPPEVGCISRADGALSPALNRGSMRAAARCRARRRPSAQRR